MTVVPYRNQELTLVHHCWLDLDHLQFSSAFTYKVYTSSSSPPSFSVEWFSFWMYLLIFVIIVIVQSLSCVRTLRNPMDCSTPGFPVLHHLPESAKAHVHCVNDAIQPSYLLLTPSPVFFSLSRNRVFTSDLALPIRWPKYWSFSFSISPSSEYSGLVFSLGLTSLILLCKGQHHSSKASVLQCSAFFMVQLWHPYMATGKTIALTIHTFVDKVILAFLYVV